MVGALQRIEIEAKNLGISKTLVSGRIAWVTVCASCCKEEKMRWSDTVPTNVMIKKLKNKGWVLHDKTGSWVCPQCSDILVKRERDERKRNVLNQKRRAFEPSVVQTGDVEPWQNGAKMSKEVLKNGTATTAGRIDLIPPSLKTLSANPKLERKIFELLQDHFDEKTRIYEKEWSDVRISQETGASPQFVSAKRIGWFGEIAEDPAITALREDVELFELELGEKWKSMENEMAALRIKLSELTARLPARLK